MIKNSKMELIDSSTQYRFLSILGLKEVWCLYLFVYLILYFSQTSVFTIIIS